MTAEIIDFSTARLSRPIPARWVDAEDRVAIEISGDAESDHCFVFQVRRGKVTDYHSGWFRERNLSGPINYVEAVIEARRWCAQLGLPRLGE